MDGRHPGRQTVAMQSSKRARHLAALVLAIVVTALATAEFLDFAPGWMDRRNPVLPALLGMTVLLLVLNMVLDGREPA